MPERRIIKIQDVRETGPGRVAIDGIDRAGRLRTVELTAEQLIEIITKLLT